MKKYLDFSKIKFIMFSIFGICFFFVPIYEKQNLLSLIVSFLKIISEDYMPFFLLVLGVVFLLMIFINPNKKTIRKHISKMTIVDKCLCVMGTIFIFMCVFDVGPKELIGNETGKLALSLASDVFITVFVAGVAVAFVSSFGLLQFVGTILQPIMRPLYNLPGCAGIDIATSMASSPTVDIYLSNKMYCEKLYTKREVSVVVTNFSLCSIGFFAVLCEMADIVPYTGWVILCSFLLSLIMPFFTMRMYPLSKIPDVYIDGTIKNKDPNNVKTKLFRRAWESAIDISKTAKWSDILNGYIDSVYFAIKIVFYIMSIATIALYISTNTDVFKWIGAPMVPLLKLFNIPDAKIIAPSVLIGIIELALPTMLITDTTISIAARFFVVVLSSLQVVFFTESANAILESDIPIKWWQLIIIFLTRTIIAIALLSIVLFLFF